MRAPGAKLELKASTKAGEEPHVRMKRLGSTWMP